MHIFATPFGDHSPLEKIIHKDLNSRYNESRCNGCFRETFEVCHND